MSTRFFAQPEGEEIEVAGSSMKRRYRLFIKQLSNLFKISCMILNESY